MKYIVFSIVLFVIRFVYYFYLDYLNAYYDILVIFLFILLTGLDGLWICWSIHTIFRKKNYKMSIFLLGILVMTVTFPMHEIIFRVKQFLYVEKRMEFYLDIQKTYADFLDVNSLIRIPSDYLEACGYSREVLYYKKLQEDFIAFFPQETGITHKSGAMLIYSTVEEESLLCMICDSKEIWTDQYTIGYKQQGRDWWYFTWDSGYTGWKENKKKLINYIKRAYIDREYVNEQISIPSKYQPAAGGHGHVFLYKDHDVIYIAIPMKINEEREETGSAYVYFEDDYVNAYRIIRDMLKLDKETVGNIINNDNGWHYVFW